MPIVSCSDNRPALPISVPLLIGSPVAYKACRILQSASSAPLSKKPGIYAPLPCFFDENDELDLESYKRHVIYTAKFGIMPTVSGSMGEAHHLTHPERASLVQAAGSALDSVGLQDVPIMAGTGAMSTKETIQLCNEAADAGADYVIVVPPGYYAGALMQDGYVAVKQFYLDVAAGSPLPVCMYNFPAVMGGMDMDSDLILDIAKLGPNLCGVKLTCGAVGKLTRICSTVSSPSFAQAYPRKSSNSPFLVLDGFVDILLASIPVGGAGSITGVSNFAPLACSRLWDLCQKPLVEEGLEEARELQGLIAQADWAASKSNIPGMKWLLANLFGYNPNPRRPLLPYSDNQGKKLLDDPYIQALLKLEENLRSNRA